MVRSFESFLLTFLICVVSNFPAMSQTEFVKVISHRGAAGVAPENTLPAVEAGLKAGAEYIEIDVHLTKDGEFAVIHDRTVKRTTGTTGRVKDLSLDELKKLDARKSMPSFQGKANIPSLDEVLDLFAAYPNATIAIEVKPGETGEDIPGKLTELIAKRKMYDQVIVISFKHKLLELIADKDPKVRIGYLSFLPPSKATPNSTHSVWWVSTLFFPKRIRKLMSQGVEIWVWTVNKKSRMEKLKQFGVNGIVTDYPSLVNG